ARLHFVGERFAEDEDDRFAAVESRDDLAIPDVVAMRAADRDKGAKIVEMVGRFVQRRRRVGRPVARARRLHIEPRARARPVSVPRTARSFPMYTPVSPNASTDGLRSRPSACPDTR